MGLHINQNKTKFMATNINTRAGNADANFIINDQNFESVKEFIYLGTSVNPNNNTSEEIKRRKIIANRCYRGLSNYLANKRLSQKTRIRLRYNFELQMSTSTRCGEERSRQLENARKGQNRLA
ncbi:unnamed protein product [Diabrotica balteata]|uniref:Reverse transcriptase domain-containing protein n=1 Tax=Diabrotica balteata TaxID=107213 RepID=A0A9N9T3V0_DIABA|nr:unnamed protein product [Diabrotica balteata]